MALLINAKAGSVSELSLISNFGRCSFMFEIILYAVYLAGFAVIRLERD